MRSMKDPYHVVLVISGLCGEALHKGRGTEDLLIEDALILGVKLGAEASVL